jgi:hypothetical protein
MNHNPNHITGSSQSAAKLILALLFVTFVARLQAQEAAAPLLERLNGTTWKWSPTNIGGTTTTTVTFKGSTLEYSWGGSGALSPTADPLTIALKTADGIVLDMVFDPFTSGFEVKNGPRIIARGRKPRELKEATAPVSVASEKQLKLKQGFDTPMQGGTATLDDLQRLFGTVAKPNVDLTGDDETVIYEKITYLMPVREAIASLNLGTRLPSKVLVACPGFPRDSFYYYALDGRFEGHYNRIYLVVDREDQVVSVELVDETPQTPSIYSNNDEGWHTYDFVNARSKAMSTLRIDNKFTYVSKDLHDRKANSKPGWRLGRVESLLLQPDRKQYGRLEAKQQTKWFVPREIVELILTCVKKPSR